MKHLILTVFFAFMLASYSFSQNDWQKSRDKDQPVISMIDSNRLYIQNVKQGEILQLFSIVGVKVLDIKVDSSYSMEVTLNVPKGYYIIKAPNFVRKIAVR